MMMMMRALQRVVRWKWQLPEQEERRYRRRKWTTLTWSYIAGLRSRRNRWTGSRMKCVGGSWRRDTLVYASK
jgi:hypothetical protein